jgi:ADP-ribose pyrophosphatase YjhB (NUDIX family)
MSIDDPRSSKRDHEEEYFRKQDQELIDRMRRSASADTARRELGEKTGIQDPELLNQIEQLGFTAETVALLPIVPLLQVAWAEGGVSPAERALLVEFARKRGIAEGSAADEQLRMWLDTKPAPSVFHQASRLAAAVLAAHGGGGSNADDVVKQAEAIASASGGVLGLGKVSAEEKAALGQIAAAFKRKS